MSNCLQVLASYADWLSNNPFGQFPRPHPLFFSDINCAGSMWPPFDFTPTENKDVLTPFEPRFGSFYIPPNWQVILKRGGNRRTLCANEVSTLVTNTQPF